MSTLKIIGPTDDLLLEPEVETLCATRDQERLAAYKWLQALGNQLGLLTCKSASPLTLDSFTPPIRFLLDRLQPGDKRSISQDGAVTITCKRPAGEVQLTCDMTGAESLPILVCMMDQCAVGMAAAAWWKADAPLLVEFVFDKIHRIHNDLKHAKTAQMTDAIVKTSYCGGINYRPFGSGAFFAEKQKILKSFLECERWEVWLHLSSSFATVT